MSTLYIRLPSKAAADSAHHWLASPCPFALVSHGSAIERQGTAPLSDLSHTVAKVQRVVLLLAASDVALLHVQLPPLSFARLKAALPNLVEDKLITDPSDCVVVAGGLANGLRTIAVVQRSWLAILAKTLSAFGARQIIALPAQLCLTHPPGQSAQSDSVIAAIHPWEGDIDLTLRLSEQHGIGLAITPVSDSDTGSAQSTQVVSQSIEHTQNESTALEVIRTLCVVVPEATIALYVPPGAVRVYQQALNDSAALSKRITLLADNWSHWISGANATTLDLMAGLGAASGIKLDWRPWRWALALGAAVLTLNAAALNIDWWRMKGENNSLRAAMVQVYKTAYPKESVIIDPLAQMQQKIAAAKHASGLAAADDLTAILAAFGEAWSNAGAAGKTSAIAAIEYHERSLYVRLKPVLSQAEGPDREVPTSQIKAALAQRDLALESAPEQSGAVVWKIRSAK
ncbi:MAG: type II secretion system protein GspL [Gallionella sp.]